MKTALINDDPIRFSSGGYLSAEGRAVLALKSAAEQVENIRYYDRGLYELEEDYETKTLLDEAYISIRKTLLRYYDPDELGLFYEPPTAAPTQPEPEAAAKTEALAPEPKRVIGLPFRRKGQQS